MYKVSGHIAPRDTKCAMLKDDDDDKVYLCDLKK
jgi:hypothetical protein